jgi:hypothetical protein
MLLFYFCTAKIISNFLPPAAVAPQSQSRALRAAALTIECFHVRCIVRLRVDDPTQLRWRLLLAELHPGGGGGEGAAVEAVAVGVRARESLRLLLLPLAGEGIGLETLLLWRLSVRRIA